MKTKLSKINKINIVLNGPSGSGKSVLAKLLAKDIGYKFYDIDSLIEKKTKMTINEIFSKKSEDYFRYIEEIECLYYLNIENAVISLGGGAIINKKIRETIEKKSFSIYLKVDIDILNKRLIKSKKRPLLKNVNIKKKITELINSRKKYYNKSDLVIDNSKNTEESLNRIKNYLNNL